MEGGKGVGEGTEEPDMDLGVGGGVHLEGVV